MFQWLNGPGSIFKDPPPGSTCYLGAYDKEGQLRSALKDQKETGGNVERNRDDLETEEDEDDTKGENHGRAIVRQSDRRPFPLNQYFKSQSVLSEELKDEIWRRVMEMGQSVKVVSTGLNVEMRRVGAVVRLKSVEKQWVEQVCWIHTSIVLAAYMMRNIKSISLEDHLMVTKEKKITTL